MPGETFSGKAVVFGDSVDTDSILSGKHLAITDEKILAGCLFEGYPDEARKQLTKDHIIIAAVIQTFIMRCQEPYAAVPVCKRISAYRVS